MAYVHQRGRRDRKLEPRPGAKSADTKATTDLPRTANTRATAYVCAHEGNQNLDTLPPNAPRGTMGGGWHRLAGKMAPSPAQRSSRQGDTRKRARKRKGAAQRCRRGGTRKAANRHTAQLRVKEKGAAQRCRRRGTRKRPIDTRHHLAPST